MEIEIREARRADVPAVAAIEQDAFSDPWSEAAFGDLVDRPAVIFLVAVANAERSPYADGALGAAPPGEGRVVGYAIVYWVEGEGDLANLAVSAAVRGAGVGRRLMRAARAAARARGVQALYLEVRTSNVVARRLYQEEGFLEVGRRAGYYVHPVEDALILRLEPV